jgi:signal transduction histidine kinase
VEIFGFLIEKWETLAGIAAVASTALLFWLAGHFVRRQECDKHRQEAREGQEARDRRHAAAEAGHAALEARVRGVPSAEVLTEIRVELTRMNGRIDAMQEQIRGQQEVLEIVRRQCERMNAYLLEHGGK